MMKLSEQAIWLEMSTWLFIFILVFVKDSIVGK